MYYNSVSTPAMLKTGTSLLGRIDELLHSSHLYFPNKILVTQQELYDKYRDELDRNEFRTKVFVRGGCVGEAPDVIRQCRDMDCLIVAFGGGSVLDLVKYCADKMGHPYINVPSALSNDAVYSTVARLSQNGRKISFSVHPPIGVIVDFDVIREAPEILLYAGLADLVTNLSALQDWKLANEAIGEPINEMAYMLSKQSVIPLFRYEEKDMKSEAFLLDLTHGLITSGLSMVVCGSTRANSGAEHLISHAIDEYFPQRSGIHGLQVGWAQEIIYRRYRKGRTAEYDITEYYGRMGLLRVFRDHIKWSEDEFESLIPYAMQIRNRYTIFNTLCY